MRWAAIDLEEGNWYLDTDETKSDRAHIVPLSPLAVEILKSLPRRVGLPRKVRSNPRHSY